MNQFLGISDCDLTLLWKKRRTDVVPSQIKGRSCHNGVCGRTKLQTRAGQQHVIKGFQLYFQRLSKKPNKALQIQTKSRSKNLQDRFCRNMEKLSTNTWVENGV
ncbi:hypothetical protein AMECASPLE_004485 [Ameca splendens]|uniref:Uncharacterized protein n=1 Tax=Ameca splendens TaxID=208324 RepID=A0ABV0XMV6_9TELE